MRLIEKTIGMKVMQSLYEDYNLPSDEDIEAEVEKYRTSQLDKIAKHEQDDEVKHQEMLNYFKQQKKDYMKNRKDSLKKYRDDNDPNEERLNAKREELKKKREEDRANYQRWFEEAKEKKARYFSDVNALTDLSDKENPGDFKYGGFNVCFTYNGKSYWVGWYDSDVYLSGDARDGYYQWEYGYEIPNSDVHKWKREISPIKEMRPEEFGLEVKPGSKDRVKGIINLNKLGGKAEEPRETSNEAIAKELDSLGESAPVDDYIAKLNALKNEYGFGYSDPDKDAEIEKQIVDILNKMPEGTVLCQNIMSSDSGFTSHGSYYHKYAVTLKYTKEGNEWRGRYGLKSVNDMLLSVVHNDSDIRSEEDAAIVQKEMEKKNSTSRRDYAPKSTIDPDNPHWDGNRYGI
jgi:hypothetical protein